MFIDSHCHLDKVDLSPYNGDFNKMLESAFYRKINTMLSVSIELDTFAVMYQLIQPYANIFASLGVHPLSAATEIIETEQLVDLANRHSKVIAIGETGLDYYYQTDTKDQQQASFINHLKAASQLSMPVIVHTREARVDTLEIIRQQANLDASGVIHCFTEDWETAKAALDMNYYISFSGIVTFKSAKELRDVAKLIPLDKLLIETDSPYLAPVPYRGRENEPQYLLEVAKCIAEVKGVSLEEIATATSENFYRLFSKAQ